MSYDARTALLESMPDEAWSLLCTLADESEAVIEDFGLAEISGTIVATGPDGITRRLTF